MHYVFCKFESGKISLIKRKGGDDAIFEHWHTICLLI